MKKIVTIIAILLTVNIANAQIQAEHFVDGPMVGAVTDSVTPVNIILGKGNQNHIYHIALKNVTQNSTIQANGSQTLCVGDSCVFTSYFSNLTPGNQYYAVVYKDNLPLDSTRSNFTIPDNNINDFTFLIGSCAKQYSSSSSYFVRENIFDQMSSETSSEFMLWLGDQIYLPYTGLSKQKMFDTYMFYKTESTKRRNFLKKSFHLGIWDDHDYSYNNGTKDFPLKEQSTELYKTFWPNTGYKYQDYQHGIYGKYSYEDIDIFLTDSRYYKSRYEYLGREQLDWLKQALLQSTATFKFITLGSITVVPAIRNDSETYIYQTGERDELFDFIFQNNITGVIFLSGDIHRAYFGQYQPNCNSTYPIYEFTSSPLTSTAGNGHYNYADLFIEMNQVNNYGKIDITGTQGNRVCTMTAKDASGNTLYTLSVNENELKTSSQPDINPTSVLTAQYDFTGNTNDSSPNGHHATANGASLTFDRMANNNSAYLFNAYPNTIEIPNAVMNNKNNFTISFWIKPTVHNCGLLSGASSTNGNELLIYYGSTKKISFNVHNTALYSKDTVRLNEWTHIALTRNGTTGEARMYINGAINGRTNLPTGTLEIVSNALLFGNDQDGGGGGNLDPNQQFKGVMDDLRFYDDELCLLQIEDLYNEGIKNVTAITNDTICEPGTVDFITTGTSNGNYKWYKTREGNSLITNNDSVYSTTITETKTYWVSADNYWTETERKPVTITVAPKIYTDADSLTYPSELSAWYPFDGNGAEVTQNYGNATVNGATLTMGRTGNTNGAYHFSSYLDLINIPNQTVDGAERISLSFWMKTTSSSDGIISMASSEAGNELLIYLKADGSLEVTLNESEKIFGSHIVNDGLWHHIVFTANCAEGQGLLYVDGEKAVPGNGYFNPGELDVPSNAFVIGNDQDNAYGGGFSTTQQYVGDFDDLKIYRRILTEQEVLDLYNDNVKYKEAFHYNWNALKFCEGDVFNLSLTKTQNNVNYDLYESGQLITNGILNNDTVSFSAIINNDNIFTITANNDYNCSRDFDSTFAVESVNIPQTPTIIANGSNLCTDVQAEQYQWLLNGNPISTQDCITISGDGEYEVYLTNLPNCSSDTSSVYTYYTSINQHNENQVSIYPIPAQNNLIIDLNNNNNNNKVNYSIIDASGKMVKQGTITNKKEVVNIENLAKGSYTIIITSPNNKISTINFVKI